MAREKKADRERNRGRRDRVTPAYRRLRRDLARVGYILKGSLQIRTVVCGHPTCRCHKNRRFRHGPYYWWTSKVAGKTVTYVLPEEEGRLYVAWAKNRQWMEVIIEKMHEESSRVAQHQFHQPPPSFRRK